MTTKTTARPGRRDASVIGIAAGKLMERLKRSRPGDFEEVLGDSEEETREQLASALRGAWHGDGYEIAKHLEREGWDVDAQLVAEVDDGCLEDAYDERLRLWVSENNIVPALAVGAIVTVNPGVIGAKDPAAQGEITAIDICRGTYTVCVPAWGHVRKGLGTHGRIWSWEELEGWQTSAGPTTTTAA